MRALQLHRCDHSKYGRSKRMLAGAKAWALVSITILIGVLPTYSQKSSEASISDPAHGALQLQNLLADRLQMNQYSSATGPKYISMKDEISLWAIRQFNGESAKVRVFWDSLPPELGLEATHSIGWKGEALSIRIRDKTNSPEVVNPDDAFETMWGGLVYELISLEDGPLILDTYRQARMGQLSRSQFFLIVAKHDFELARRTEDFWRNVWKPWSDSNGFATKKELWFRSGPGSFSEWYAHQVANEKKTGYPSDTLGRIYDWLVQKKEEKASSTTDTTLPSKPAPETSAKQ